MRDLGRIMRTRTVHLLQLLSVLALLSSTNAAAQEFAVDKNDIPEQKTNYSPYVDQHFPQRVLWGDTHHHTSYSFDGGLMGTKLNPADGFASHVARR